MTYTYPANSSEKIKGTFVDAKGNTITFETPGVFNEDGTALVNQTKINYSLLNDHISFESNTISIDECVYQINSTGGLLAPIKIFLNLIILRN